MALIGSPASFVVAEATRDFVCMECGRRVAKGKRILVSYRGGKLRKRVCSEDCRKTFDEEYWLQQIEKTDRGLR